MKKSLRVLTLFLTVTMLVSLLAACGGNSNANSNSTNSGNSAAGETELKKDTIKALLPPVSANFQSNFDQMEADFNALYPHLTLEIEPASWEDMTQKLDTQVNAGSPPDIAFIGSGSISKYAKLGMLLNIKNALTDEMKADFDEIPYQYMSLGEEQYGLPGYITVHALGGNKKFLEEAGIDWKNVQDNGWTYEQFRDAIKAGVVTENGKTSRYGFVFATAGVASKDYLSIMSKSAGMPYYFDEDLKFTHTSQNFLKLLEKIREMITDGSMPKELSSVDAGKRWNMFLTGQTMITGKGLASFENSAKLNNAKIAANDGSAVASSIEAEYIVLPTPSFFGEAFVPTTVVDGYVSFRGKKDPTEEHTKNVALAAYFLASGKIAATTNEELFASHITNSAREIAATFTTERSEENKVAEENMIAQAVPNRTDIPTDLAAEAIKIETEVIVPKLQGLLAGEVTPQQMYDAVKAAAIKSFGEDGIVKD
jgi:multiple sugar transport system substrate-binding protein